MDRNIALAVANCGTATVKGVFHRHVSRNVRALGGSAAGGRWGAPGAYPVLYLGRPIESVIVEAYRHLVDDVEGMRPELVAPRRVLTIGVDLTNILDLRDIDNQRAIGFDGVDLTTRVGDYQQCQRVGQAAHQLGLHGILAPAATGLGETLAVFEAHLPPAESPTVIEEAMWTALPPDPRLPRLLSSGTGDAAY